MPPGSGAELDRVVDGTGGPSVPEELSRVGGFEGKSPTKEQASRVLWLYCSRSMNLSNGNYSCTYGHLLYTDNVKRYILFFFLSSSPNGCSILVCWFLQRHSRGNNNVDVIF